MFSNEKVYPEWVRQYKVKGTVIKKVNGSYYLYKRTSKRVEGKKYPQAVDRYIGVITKEGIVNAKAKIIPLSSDCVVKEYGLSRTLLGIVPEGWKKNVGENWKEVLYILIDRHIENSYLAYEFSIPEKEDNRNTTFAYWNSLFRRLNQEYGVSFDEFSSLKNIYKVYIDSKTFISRIDEGQRKILEKLRIDLSKVY